MGEKGILWGKNFGALDMVVSFVAGFVDRDTGYGQFSLIRQAHAMYIGRA